jgi:hypothetical protein
MEEEQDDVVRMGDFYEDCRYHPMFCVWRDDDMLTGVSLVNGQIGCCSATHCGVRKLDRHDALYLRMCGPLDAWDLKEKCPWPREKQWWRENAVENSMHSREIVIRVPEGWKVYPGWHPEGGALYESSDQMHWSEDMFGATGDEWVIDIGSYGNSHVYTCLALRRRPMREVYPDDVEEVMRHSGLKSPDDLIVDWENPDFTVDFHHPEEAAAWAEGWMRRGGPPEEP